MQFSFVEELIYMLNLSRVERLSVWGGKDYLRD